MSELAELLEDLKPWKKWALIVFVVLLPGVALGIWILLLSDIVKERRLESLQP